MLSLVAIGMVCRSTSWVQDEKSDQLFGLIAIKFCTDIHGSQRINPIDNVDLFTFP